MRPHLSGSPRATSGLLLLVLLLSACGGGDDDDDPTPTSSAGSATTSAVDTPVAAVVAVSPTVVPAVATSTVGPTTAAAATATLTSVAETPTPVPTPEPDETAMVIRWTDAFDRIWNATDAPVADGTTTYSGAQWFWGPEQNDARTEEWVDSPSGTREVRHYDKSAMEIRDPYGDPSDPNFVTQGNLTIELITGRIQNGDDTFVQLEPSPFLVVGDPDTNPGTPSYATFARYATTDGQSNRASDRTGQEVTEFLSGSGELSSTESAGVTLASYQDATGHNIASVFWDWINDPASGFQPDLGLDWLYMLGLPISEPYWIDSTDDAGEKRVLVQLFERRVVTYTPNNDELYRIEFGNVGQHYYFWRYDR